ncbi:hypothetical protein ACHAQJ_005198 [Trichoderma viride]
MKPRLYPGRSTSARNGIVVTPEDDMMQSDAELGAMEEQMTTEVNQEFDTDRTTDTTTHEDGKPVHVSKRRDWTPEEDKTMKSYFKSGKTQQQIATEVHQESDIDRTQSAIYKRVGQLMRRLEQRAWTPKEDETIKLGLELRKTHGQIAAELNQGPSTSQVKVDQVRERIEELRLVKKAAPYTEAEQAMIILGAQLGKSASEIAAEVNKEFHNDRSTNAISRQRKILMGPDFEVWAPGMESFRAQSPPDYCEFRGAHTNRCEVVGGADWFQKNSGCGGSQKRWTSKEDEFLETLRDGYNDESRYQAWKKEFGPTRTLTSLKTRLVRLSKNPRGKLHRWTLEEDNYLRSYPDLSKGWKLAKKLALTWEEAFGHPRTASAIQHRLYPLSDASKSMEQCSRWSPSEDAWLLTVTKEEVEVKDWQSAHMAFVDKFGMGRTANALRARRVYLRQAAAEAKAETSGSLDEEREERENAIATSGRPGPVLIDLPKDITAGILRKAIPTQTCLPSFPSIASQAAKRLMEKQLNTSLSRAAELIKVAKQPIIYAGQGIIQSKGGIELLRELADKCSIPVTTTLLGLGAFDERDEKSLHMLGMHGMAYANMSMQEADLIIALGARFDDRVVLNTSKFAAKAKAAAAEKRGGIIHFDILPKNINKVIQATEAIEGDVATNLKMLIPMLTSTSMEQRSEWFNKISGWKAKWPLSNYERADSPGGNDLIKPQSLIEELSDLTSKIDKKTIISTGMGQHQMWVAQHYSWREPRSFVTSGGLGTMGFGLPSAIGIAVARPDALVIDIDGDASFNMTLTELSTAAQFNIGIKVISLNNEEQGMVTQWQNLFYEDRYAHTHQRNPDFIKLADAMGVQARKVSKPEDVRASLEWLMNTDGPALLEVITDKKVPLLPMVPAGAGLHEFLVYDKEKDKARRQLMRERTNGLHGS